MAGKKASKRIARQQKRIESDRRKKALQVTVIVVVLASLAFFYWQSMRPAEPLAHEAVIAQGAQIYDEQCATCHGDQGQGHAALAQAPALDGSEHSWHHPDGQLQTLLEQGGNLMPAFGDKLTDGEIYAVIRFIQTWWSADQLASQQQASESNPFR